MSNRNDITGDKIRTKGILSKEGGDRFDAIFRKESPPERVTKMNTIETAIKCGVIGLSIDPIHNQKQLQAFAQAVIEDYKAGLVPVAHIDINNRKLEFTSKFDFSNLALCGDYPPVQLYALGETK